jgi:hypothetical protein
VDADVCLAQPKNSSGAPKSSIQYFVKPLRFLVDAFVNTFGITQPTPQKERKAGVFIALMLAGVLVFLCLVAYALRYTLLH